MIYIAKNFDFNMNKACFTKNRFMINICKMIIKIFYNKFTTQRKNIEPIFNHKVSLQMKS